MSEASQPEDYLPSYETEAARRAWRRRTSLEMIISGFIGLVTSFVLSIEAWQLAVDSSARFGCDGLLRALVLGGRPDVAGAHPRLP